MRERTEDGIRDTSVTGVQTYALPISSDLRSVRSQIRSLAFARGFGASGPPSFELRRNKAWSAGGRDCFCCSREYPASARQIVASGPDDSSYALNSWSSKATNKPGK